MTKFAMFCAKPITWGAYFKMCGICLGISCVYAFAFWLIVSNTNY